jgi:hypothetical protein
MCHQFHETQPLEPGPPFRGLAAECQTSAGVSRRPIARPIPFQVRSLPINLGRIRGACGLWLAADRGLTESRSGPLDPSQRTWSSEVRNFNAFRSIPKAVRTGRVGHRNAISRPAPWKGTQGALPPIHSGSEGHAPARTKLDVHPSAARREQCQQAVMEGQVSEHEFVTSMLVVVGFGATAMSYIAYRIFKILHRLEVDVAPTLPEVRRALGQPW